MNSLFSYLRRPYYISDNRPPSFVGFVGLIGIYLLATSFTGLILVIACHLLGIEKKSIDFSFNDKLAVVILMAPVYEEIFFRSLLKLKKINALLFVFVISGLVFYASIKSKTSYIAVFSIILIAFFGALLLLKKDRIKSFAEKYFAYIFYASALLFGLIHANNFTGETWKLIIFSFILGGPQIVLGIMLGYIRMSYGLFYSILFHAIINSSVLLMHVVKS